jgi:hypothetical protein
MVTGAVSANAWRETITLKLPGAAAAVYIPLGVIVPPVAE